MGLFGSRESEMLLELRTAPANAYVALIRAFADADLNVTTEDKRLLSAVAETSLAKAMLRNSWGESVTFTITEKDGGRCLVTIRAVAKRKIGSSSAASHVEKISGGDRSMSE